MPVLSTRRHQPQQAKLKKELCVFLIFLGLLLSFAGYLLYTHNVGSGVPIWGLPRHVAWGVPTLVIGALFFLSGLALAITSSRASVILGMVAGVALAVFYFAIMVSVSGEFPINLISLVIIATPILLVQRGSLFLKGQHGPSPQATAASQEAGSDLP